jgi:hypothetical protein
VTRQKANPKSAAWDLVGGQFWESGRQTARPSAAEIERMTRGIAAGARCVVVGASTRDLVVALLGRGAKVTVLDFAERMCADLRAALPPQACPIHQHDITGSPPGPLAGSQDCVLSDRLINRFSESEALPGLRGMADLLAMGGELRTSVKLGLYPMDRRMIELGRRHGCLAAFYDERQRVMNFTAAGQILEEALLPHGDIPAEVLLNWYRGRGSEKRFEHEDVVGLFAKSGSRRGRLRLVSSEPLPDAPATRLYVGRLEGPD